jgi:UDP-glucose 4-epimerase
LQVRSTTSAEILVTGGTGFVGRALVNALAGKGYAVRVLSRRHVSPDLPGVTVVQGDVTSAIDVRRAVLGCGAVFHCAAEKSDASRMSAANVAATQHLCDAARDAGVDFFCHLSSVGTIGQTNRTVVDESAPCHPMNLYEETKLAAERIIAEGFDRRTVILRPTNIFGPENVLSFCDRSPAGRVRMFLKGREGSHLVYVKDVAAAAVFLFRRTGGERVATYIVSSDEEQGNTNREVRAYLGSRLGIDSARPVVSAPFLVPYLMRRLRRGAANRGDVIYSSRKLRSAGFDFPFGLRGGLDDAVSSLATGMAARASSA